MANSNNCVNYNCTSLGTRLPAECGVFLKGGISDFILLNCDHEITDPSDDIQIQAELDAGRATLVSGVRIGLDAPSANTIDSLIACAPDPVLNYDRTATIVDGSVCENIDFLNDLSDGRLFGGIIFRLCDECKVLWVDAAVSFAGGVIVPDNNTEAVRYEGTVSWKDTRNPKFYTEPIGIF